MALSYRLVAEIDWELFHAAQSMGASQIFQVFAGCGDLCRLRYVPRPDEGAGGDFAVVAPCERCSHPCKDRHGTDLSKVVLGAGALEEDSFWIVLSSTPCERIVEHVRRIASYFLIVFSPQYTGEDNILPADTGVFGLRRILKDAKDAVTEAWKASASPTQLLEICNNSLNQGFEREINNARQVNLPLLEHFMQIWKDCVKCYAG